MSLDFNILDDDLLSFPMDEFNPIESREIENILNELEQSTNEKALMSPFNQMRPTIMFNNARAGNKASKKSKSSKIGTSLLAKPPKKLKKDKNSLLSRNGVATTSSLLFNAGNRKMNSVIISQAAFSAYFYEDHNYCFNPQPTIGRSAEVNESAPVDLNNNQNELVDECRLAGTSCLTIETKEIVIDDTQVLKKKASLANGVSTLNLISPNNMFATSDCETVHDLDDYFNISFSEEGGSSTDSTNQSETEDENNRFDLESEISQLDSRKEAEEEREEMGSEQAKQLTEEQNVKQSANESIHEPVESAKASNDEIMKPLSQPDAEPAKSAESPAAHGGDQVAANKADPTTVKSVLIDDINNYNINEINDTDNELISLDEDDEDDDILIETDETEEFILIDEMFGDFPEYDLISSAKKGKHSAKNLANKRVSNSRSNSMSSHRSNSFSKSPKVQVVAGNANRRTRTISNSYSVRSGSSCSCCSEDMSEEEQQSPSKRNETVTGKLTGHQQSKSIGKPNRRSTSKLIKADNSFIKKKNNGRFLMHKNTSF